VVFVFNWSPDQTYEGLAVGAPEPGKYRVSGRGEGREGRGGGGGARAGAWQSS
jgi:hypothetical protein